MKTTRYALTVLAIAAITGCASKVDLEKPAPVETARPVQTVAPTATPAPMAEPKVATVDLGAELARTVADKRVVYFDFDSYVVKSDYQGLVELHATRLNKLKNVSLRLEGNTDERGGSEYNLALGQKRAEAVAKSLESLGVQAGQVEPVSFGKERPAAEGHNEAAWAQNRRVELKDK